MPRIIPQHELDQLVEFLRASPAGLSLEALLQHLGSNLQPRTLQRRLAELVAQGRIQRVGNRRGARYHANPPPSQPASPAALLAPVPTEAELPLCAEAIAIRIHVRQPRQHRTPVGYRLDFLADYHPNHTHYLPPSLREQLHELGRSPAEQTPAGTFARDILNRLLIDLSWASSHLEGNTYSRLDTERLIELGQAAEGKNAFETQMILNHKQAIEYLVLDPAHAQLSTETLIALHAFLSDGLMADPAAVGRQRVPAAGAAAATGGAVRYRGAHGRRNYRSV